MPVMSADSSRPVMMISPPPSGTDWFFRRILGRAHSQEGYYREFFNPTLAIASASFRAAPRRPTPSIGGHKPIAV
jgi:hypothetical protein